MSADEVCIEGLEFMLIVETDKGLGNIFWLIIAACMKHLIAMYCLCFLSHLVLPLGAGIWTPFSALEIPGCWTSDLQLALGGR